MKTFAQRTLVALVICALATFSALAGSKDSKVKKSIVFSTDTMVNGKTVKAGTYKLTFDQQTGELNIADGSKIVATTTAHLEKRENRARDTVVRTVAKDNTVELVSVTFGGWDQDLVVGGNRQASSN
jgi:hypothetical protein